MSSDLAGQCRVTAEGKIHRNDKEKIAPMMHELNSMVDELNERLQCLEKECPTDWSSDENGIEDKINKMRSKWKEVWAR